MKFGCIPECSLIPGCYRGSSVALAALMSPRHWCPAPCGFLAEEKEQRIRARFEEETSGSGLPLAAWRARSSSNRRRMAAARELAGGRKGEAEAVPRES